MSTSNASGNRHTAETVTHSKDRAIDDFQFELLLDASYGLESMQDLETRFVLLVAGRLGLRRGEIAHMRESWVDWRQRRIDIPEYVDCDMGRGGGPCGSCKQQAKQRAEHNDGVTYEEALAERWTPKTSMACRSVPFGFSGRVEVVLERFFNEFDRWMYTAQSINRRLDWVADRVDKVEEISPHALRASAATYHAGRGLDTLSLQSLFGWACASTSKAYIASSADNLDRQLQFIHK